MARSKKYGQRRDWRKTLFWVIALLVALSMIASSVLIAIQPPS